MTAKFYLNTHNVHRLDAEEQRLLFHVPTTSIFALDDLSADLLNLLKHEPETSLATIQQGLCTTHAPEEVEQTIRDFLAMEIISQEKEGRAHNPLPLELKELPLNTVVLNVNTGCNLSCTYCYKEDLTSPSKGQKMSLETAIRSIDLLLEESPDQDSYNIVFFGGEPLTNLPLIKSVVEHAEPRFAALKKQVDFSLTTNATLLKESTVDWLNAHRFGLTVSIDGPKALHDKNRLSIKGQGTYDLVASKVKMLLKRYTSRPVGARVTLTRGVTDIVGIWDHLFNDLGFNEVGFSPVTSGDISLFNLSNDELVQVFEGMKTLGKHYVVAARQNRSIGFANLHQMLTNLHEGKKKSLPCGAGTAMVAIDNTGGINLCHRFTGSDLPNFGTLETGIDKSRLGEFISERLDRAEKGCETCHIRNLCSGGCYHESYARYSDPAHPTYHYCDLMRDWVDFSVQAYAEIMAENPDFFDTYLTPRTAAKEIPQT